MRKITALSNSETTLKHTNNENGINTIIKHAANTVAAISIHFERAPPSVEYIFYIKIYSYPANITF